jgi:hypothetical protein
MFSSGRTQRSDTESSTKLHRHVEASGVAWIPLARSDFGRRAVYDPPDRNVSDTGVT